MKVNPDELQCIVFGKVVNPGTLLINGGVVIEASVGQR